jgi:oxygen-independent coproporphyrinogen-3 oxidase
MMFEATINGEKIRISNELVARYDLPLPRYTSYPTAPVWSDTIGIETLRGTLSSWNSKRSLSLYIHIPFCAEGCLFCGCHSIVTKNQRIITDYLDALEERDHET